MSEISREVSIVKDLEELDLYRKLGSVEQLSQKINEEDVLKFYYCESEDKYYVGKRLDTKYYAEIMIYQDGSVCLSYQKSRYLPWGENGYPSEPKEISFQKWLEEHDKQIRADAIDEFREYYKKRYLEEKKMELICDFALGILLEYEQLKEQKNDSNA